MALIIFGEDAPGDAGDAENMGEVAGPVSLHFCFLAAGGRCWIVARFFA